MNDLARIGRVPRVNPVEFGLDHPMIDQFGQPTTWDAPGCDEIVMVPWPNKFTEWADSPENFSILRGYNYYVNEWMLRRGQIVKRFLICARHIIDFFGPAMDPTKIKVAEGKRFEDYRYAQGCAAATIRKDLRMHLAAMHHNLKRERIEKVPYLEMPEGPALEPRPLTEDEFRALMRLNTMPYRRRMFWRLAYWTGHRSRAIELLKWPQVDLEARTINFNEPGARKTNKRRADGFPIQPELYAYLVAAKERRDARFPGDPYVIGLSQRGKTPLTYKGCKEDLKAVGVNERGVCRHSVRKLFCTSRIASGQSDSLVAALIADDPRTMRRSYVKLNTEQMRAAAENRPRAA